MIFWNDDSDSISEVSQAIVILAYSIEKDNKSN